MKEKEGKDIYDIFDAIISSDPSLSSPHFLDAVKHFSYQPGAIQKQIFKELVQHKGEAVIPLAKHLMTKSAIDVDILIESLTEAGDEVDALILSILAEQIDEKKIKKQIKKALYKLKVKGVRCPHAVDEKEPVYKKISLPRPEAYLSQIDSIGDRLIILAFPESLHFSMVYSFVINDQTGIRAFQEIFMKKNDLNSYLTGTTFPSPLTIVDVDYHYAQYLLQGAYQNNLQKGIPLPTHFTPRHKTLLQAVPDLSKPLIYDLLQQEDAVQNSALLNDAAELFEAPEIQGWLIDEQFLSQYRSKIEDLKMSSLIVSKAVYEERIESIIREALRNFFTPDLCGLYKRRLEETAYIFWKTDRQREAMLSVAVGKALDSGGTPIEIQIFPREMVRRSLFYKKEDTKESPIIIPNQRLIT